MFYDAMQAILAGAYDFHGTDPSLQRQIALGVNRLQIRRASRKLTALPARAVPEHIDGAPYQRWLNAACCAKSSACSRASRSALTSSAICSARSAAGVPGRALYLKE